MIYVKRIYKNGEPQRPAIPVCLDTQTRVFDISVIKRTLYGAYGCLTDVLCAERFSDRVRYNIILFHNANYFHIYTFTYLLIGA